MKKSQTSPTVRHQPAGKMMVIVLAAIVVALSCVGTGVVNAATNVNRNQQTQSTQSKNDKNDDNSGDPSNGTGSDEPAKEVSGKIVPVDPDQQSLQVAAIPYGPVQEGTSIDVPVVAGYYPEDSQDTDSLVVGVQVQVPKGGGTIYVTYFKSDNGSGGSGSGGGQGGGTSSSSSSSSPSKPSTSPSSNKPSSTSSSPSQGTSSSPTSTSNDTPKIPDGPSRNNSSNSSASSTMQQAAGQSSSSTKDHSLFSWFGDLFGGGSKGTSHSSSKKSSTSSSATDPSDTSDSTDNAGSKSSETSMKSAAGKQSTNHTQWLAIGITVVSAALLGGVIVLIVKQRRRG
ncbi:hypothetical protein [Schleiferilactobacillus perolens]|uniref:hypothetical protein n=1 Tax=Schleiferilactobacillus perolens TaxID=100468 RepID=UPI002357F933|nr:hypothetical protein [Schleiferilactobacillus perolens]MCI2172529.1 hypothetical protein [Schleiferilactobacillus perolens]